MNRAEWKIPFWSAQAACARGDVPKDTIAEDLVEAIRSNYEAG
jgi:hypothetical protein